MSVFNIYSTIQLWISYTPIYATSITVIDLKTLILVYTLSYTTFIIVQTVNVDAKGSLSDANSCTVDSLH